ncbi:MAG TPA: response regulator [Thermoanaerobaculia bacterium]|nr:response regulator [Thermoanaerobaculia bacterium]
MLRAREDHIMDEAGIDAPSALVVEDEEQDRENLVRILSDEGFQVSTARTGREALDCIESREFDLIVLDILLPQIDGFDVMKRIKARDPEKLRKTVIVSRLNIADLKVFFPVSKVFTKPVDPDAMRTLARRVLNGESIAEG